MSEKVCARVGYCSRCGAFWCAEHDCCTLECPKTHKAITTAAYKLFTLRKDGSLGPLFIGRRLRIRAGVWLRAEAVPTPGFAYRPGWHAAAEPWAPHLSARGRVWCRVSLRGWAEHRRPASQGGLWYVARWMRVEEVGVTPGRRIRARDCVAPDTPATRRKQKG